MREPAWRARYAAADTSEARLLAAYDGIRATAARVSRSRVTGMRAVMATWRQEDGGKVAADQLRDQAARALVKLADEYSSLRCVATVHGTVRGRWGALYARRRVARRARVDSPVGKPWAKNERCDRSRTVAESDRGQCYGQFQGHSRIVGRASSGKGLATGSRADVLLCWMGSAREFRAGPRAPGPS